MSRLTYAPLSFAAVGGVIGLCYWNTEQASLAAVTGYFLGELLRSVVRTVSDPRRSA